MQYTGRQTADKKLYGSTLGVSFTGEHMIKLACIKIVFLGNFCLNI